MITGVVPALKVTRLGARLRQAGPGGGGFRFGGMWTGIIVAQVAAMVAFPVIVFYVRGFTVDIRSVDFGFATEEFLSVRLDSDREIESPTPIDASRDEFVTPFRATYRELERRLEAEPGVAGVSFSDGRPVVTRDGTRAVELDESRAMPVDSTTGSHRVRSASVGLDYLDLLNAPVLAGRRFQSADVESDAPVVIVNQSFVDIVLGGQNPIGRRIRYAQVQEPGEPRSELEPWYEIIGVVRDIGRPIAGSYPEGSGIYHPIAPGGSIPTYLLVHTRGRPESFGPRFRSIAVEVDPTLILHEIAPLDKLLRFDIDLWRLSVLFLLVSVASAGAMLLALAGIYSVLSFAVSQRTREIGIRIALGGEAHRVAVTIARRPLAQVGLGILLGGGLTAAMVHMMNEGLSAMGVAQVLSYIALMIGVCIIACIAPACRALAVEPTEALNADR